jgi:hypothetical protein
LPVITQWMSTICQPPTTYLMSESDIQLEVLCICLKVALHLASTKSIGKILPLMKSLDYLLASGQQCSCLDTDRDAQRKTVCQSLLT